MTDTVIGLAINLGMLLRAYMQSTDSFSVPLHKVEGRSIHYHVGDDDGDVDPDEEPRHFTFNGTSLDELLERLKEESGLEDVIMCSRSPINGKLLPLRLQLPPNNAAVHIVLVRESSKGAISSLSHLQLLLMFASFDSTFHEPIFLFSSSMN